MLHHTQADTLALMMRRVYDIAGQGKFERFEFVCMYTYVLYIYIYIYCWCQTKHWKRAPFLFKFTKDPRSNPNSTKYAHRSESTFCYGSAGKYEPGRTRQRGPTLSPQQGVEPPPSTAVAECCKAPRNYVNTTMYSTSSLHSDHAQVTANPHS